ncbi:MAG: type II toxin-antitoxin system VapC family toxin [Novosphingobium sp.]|uniref:type II toxin-antitoxin system VapC family toxin n=1 Tax=Novosphingobium sp. TaxID=1874826 RepID=UPI002735C7AD|nr:type II toxin-antitoxin system VapC family toxin [Novosphingobium sp.]MDP3549020.1 type II toxin-antitoxin system VapC family toxin [Novosphingobium sp.]
MILVDTSVWIDTFRAADADLALLLAEGMVLQHPFVTGELAMGNLRQWRRTIDLLSNLPPAPLIEASELLNFVERHALAGTGIGLIDAHLLATAEAAGASIWTRDQRLFGHAARLGLGWQPAEP